MRCRVWFPGPNSVDIDPEWALTFCHSHAQFTTSLGLEGETSRKKSFSMCRPNQCPKLGMVVSFRSQYWLASCNSVILLPAYQINWILLPNYVGTYERVNIKRWVPRIFISMSWTLAIASETISLGANSPKWSARSWSIYKIWTYMVISHTDRQALTGRLMERNIIFGVQWASICIFQPFWS